MESVFYEIVFRPTKGEGGGCGGGLMCYWVCRFVFCRCVLVRVCRQAGVCLCLKSEIYVTV